jgi:NAD(P)-dependent dehydrogenase (short-subunit alcohol dehydrogenase family)
MSSTDLAGRTAVVTGAGRGFGRGISTALADAGARVVGVARSAGQLGEVADQLGERFVPLAADAADPDVARAALEAHRPDILVLNAGAAPVIAPLHEQTWTSFSGNWMVDTRHVFEWVRSALLRPLPRGSTVISVSSGAALGLSPLSGGYAPAKSAIRFISAYAADESTLAGLGIRFVTVFPQLTPATDLGAAGVSAYAGREGVSIDGFVERFEPALTPQLIGQAMLAILGTDDHGPREFRISGHGLKELDQ